MSACFKVEGSEDSPGTARDIDAAPTLVDIQLCTDGSMVWIGELSWRKAAQIPDPILTPKGWLQLANDAAALLGRANTAWGLMLAER